MSQDTHSNSQFNSKFWELNLYELHRLPQKIIEDDTKIAISSRSLNSELMCPICLDMLKNTMTTKECLHRFCQECIITALRSGNKECPTCRKKLISKRSLRPDPNFDSLIAKIYPYREEYETKKERKWANLSIQTIKQCLSGQYNNNIKNGNQEIIKTSANCAQDSNDLETIIPHKHDNNSNILAPNFNLDQIEIIFKPHPNNNSTEINFSRFLKTTSNATVEHLAKYLSMRISIENIINPGISSSLSNFSISILDKNDRLISLEPHSTLEEVQLNFYDCKMPIIMYYALTIN
ncbi:unnamed protein product [Gordionus sp. m RMFG-2023]